MDSMAAPQVSGKSLALVLVATITMLFFRSWLQLTLVARGMATGLAENLSYLAAFPILLVLVAPLWRTDRAFVAAQYRLADLTLRTVTTGIALGVLIRIAWWAHVIAGGAFGLHGGTNPDSVATLEISFGCRSWPTLLTGVLVFGLIVPAIEEIVHRGYAISWLRKFGPPVAVILSSLVFMLFHMYSTWSTVFVIGLVFAVVYWRTNSLWVVTFAHGAYNTMAQIDWGCVTGRWVVAPDQIPLLRTGIPALVLMAIASIAIIKLIRNLPKAKLPGPAH